MSVLVADYPGPIVLRRAPARAAARPVGLRLTARGRSVVIALSLVLAAFATLASQQAMAGQGGGAVVVEPHTVASGETLWQIAADVTPPGEDVREVIDELMELNGLSTTQLDVGQELLVPAP